MTQTKTGKKMKFPKRRPIKQVEQNGDPLILIIEDDPGIIRLLEYKLNRYKCRLMSEDNGLDGMVSAQRLIPDLIILDLHLPKMSGEEVLKRIRNNDKLNKTKVMILTAIASEKDVKNLLQYGISGYTSKPFSVRDFVGRIENMLQLKFN